MSSLERSSTGDDSSKDTEEGTNSIEKFKIFVSSEIASLSKAKEPIWKTEDKMPNGWMVNYQGERKFIKGPSTRVFAGKRVALQFMMKNTFSEDDIQAMKNSMEDDGWQTSEDLPHGWIFKLDRSYRSKDLPRPLFLSSEGEVFRSVLAAIKSMESSEKYNEQNIETLNNFMIKTVAKCRRLWVKKNENVQKNNYEEDTQNMSVDNEAASNSALCLPEGWKTIKSGYHDYVISPEGDKFNSSRMALIEMVRRGISEDEVVTMRQSMREWTSHEHLPKGWMYKVVHKKREEKREGIECMFLTETGEWIRGGTRAVQKLEKESCDEDVIENLNIFLRDLTKSERKNRMEQGSQAMTASFVIPIVDQANFIEKTLKLPSGWKSRNVGSKYYVVSPEGEQFNSSRLGLKEMVRRGVPDVDLRSMRSSMADTEDWKESEYLPEGWMFKYERIKKQDGDHTKVKFLTSDGDLLHSFVNAIKFMELNDFSSDHIKQLNILMTQTTKEWRRAENLDFSKEEMGERLSDLGEGSLVLPEGWKSRIVGIKQYVVSPDGEQYNSNRLALKEMVKRDVSEDDLARMRASMKEWKTSELLPPKWMYKTIKNGQNYEFLSDTAKYIKSKIKALELITEFGEGAVESFKVFSDIASAKTREKAYDWKEDDKTIPEGWKSKVGGSRSYFLSPEGQQFPSRLAILKFMIDEGYEDSNIDDMRSKTIYEGWQKSVYLPSKWIFRHTWRQSVTDRDTTFSLKILSEDGHLMESYSTARTFMKFSGKHSAEEVAKIDILVEENAKMRRLSTIHEIDNVPGKNIDDVEEFPMSGRWQDDETVPVGWKVKISGKKEIFLSTDGQTFGSRRSALQKMLSENIERDSLDDMKLLVMQHEGWTINEYLPNDWLIKISYTILKPGSVVEQTRNLEILSSEGHLFKSFLAATDYIKSSDLYIEYDIAQMDLINDTASRNKRLNQSGWTKSENLPTNWKVRRTTKTDKKYYLSPNGEQFHGVAALFQHIVKSRESPEDVIAVKEELKQDGWMESKHFPSDWLIKTVGKLDVLSPEGFRFRSYLAAARFMESSDSYSDDKVEQVKALISHNLFTGPAKHGNYGKVPEALQKSGWSDDDTLPSGWKLRTQIGGKSHLSESFLTPSGQQMSSRHAALGLLVSQGGSEAEVANMRRGLKKFGWEEEPFLPPGWLKKEGGQGRPLFYSPDNREFKGPCALLDHLLTEGHGFKVS